MQTNYDSAQDVPAIRTLYLEDEKQLVVYHPPIPEGTIFYSFEPIDNRDTDILAPHVWLHLFQPRFAFLSGDQVIDGASFANLVSETTFTIVPLDGFSETTVIVTPLKDGGETTDAVIVNEEGQGSNELASPPLEEGFRASLFIKAFKGESAFGRPKDRESFLMVGFTADEAKVLARAMPLVSQSLVSKLGKFEAALPSGAGGRVWNIRKSQNREPITITSQNLGTGTCGQATIKTGKRTHPIAFALNPTLIRSSTDLGVAVVMIHEIAHQFGVLHHGWMNTGDYEGALWASHKVANVKRADIASYIAQANAEIGGC